MTHAEEGSVPVGVGVKVGVWVGVYVRVGPVGVGVTVGVSVYSWQIVPHPPGQPLGSPHTSRPLGQDGGVQ